MKTYQEGKEAAREAAIRWQQEFENHHYTYSELADWNFYWHKLGKKYGLLEEFRENGII